MGGGGLTADGIAAALVEAARSGGYDPLLFLTETQPGARRALANAVLVLAAETGRTPRYLCSLLQVSPSILPTPAPRPTPVSPPAPVNAPAPVVAPEPPAVAPSHTPIPRRVAPRLQPAVEAPLTDRILKALKDGAHSTSGMSARLGAKENAVGQALSMLRYDGKVLSDAVPAQGVRAQLWRLA